MCGLGGIFSFKSKIPSIHIHDMMQEILYRGPDDGGFLSVEKLNSRCIHYAASDSPFRAQLDAPVLQKNSEEADLWMGFRRLAIIDLSIKGHQPMSYQDGRFWITYNGEIYNYIEVKAELSALGHQFQSASDTEVILAAWAEWGRKAFSKFVGMFAIALWDREQRKLVLARDRFGVKPIAYVYNRDHFIWASEEKQIIRSGFYHKSPDLRTIKDFLCYNQIRTNEHSFFTDIKLLKPGHSIEIDDKGILSEFPYWMLEYTPSNLNEPDRLEAFNSMFTDAVRLRMRSDVPLGIALSGGLDSSSIAVTASRMTDLPIQTFSVYYEQDKKYDERPFIYEVLKKGNFQPTYFTQDNQISLAEISKWVYLQDMPSTGASPISAFYNYKNVFKEKIKVLLNGQGGDEVLAGYPYYYKYLLAHQWKNGKVGEWWRSLKGFASTQGLNSALKYQAESLATLFPFSYLQKLERKKYTTEEIYLLMKSPGYFEEDPLLHHKPHDLNDILKHTLLKTMMPHMLSWEDRNSMANSIESRVPFLDHRLVELAFTFPEEDKIRNGWSKWILRKTMDGKLPDSVQWRKDKTGFLTPTDEWTNGILKDDITDLLHSSAFKDRGLWDSKHVLKRLKTNNFGKNELWKIVNMELWFREFGI